MAGIGFVPAPVKVFGDQPELDDEIAGEVLRLDLAAFFPPQAKERVFVVAHDDAGIGATYKRAAGSAWFFPNSRFHGYFPSVKEISVMS